jgi:hypothetical protein
MAMSRKLLPALTGIALASLLVVPAGAMPVSQPQTAIQAPHQESVQQVYWRGGGAVAAGVIGGLALGAIIGGAANAYGPPPPGYYAPPPAYYAPPPPPAGDWYAYCASKYRSFDPASGTYLGYDGLRHPCQ